MNYFLQIGIIAGLEIFVPFLCGMLLSRLAGKKCITITETMLYGTFAMFSGFLVIAVVSAQGNFSLSFLTKLWMGIAVVISVAAVVICRKEIRTLLTSVKHGWKFLAVVFLLAVFAVLFITPEQYSEVPAIVMRTVSTDSLYVYEPYAGVAYEAIPGVLKYAPLDLYYAMLACITGMHPLTLLNIVQPLLWIPLCYAGYLQWGKLLFTEKKQTYYFIAMITLLNCYPVLTDRGTGLEVFSGVWQRDTLLCSLILPALILICLKWAYQLETTRTLLFFMECCAGAAELVMYKAVFYAAVIIIIAIAIRYIGGWKKCTTS